MLLHVTTAMIDNGMVKGIPIVLKSIINIIIIIIVRHITRGEHFKLFYFFFSFKAYLPQMDTNNIKGSLILQHTTQMCV